jgi:LemA protein
MLYIYIVCILLALILFWALFVFNAMIYKRNLCKEAWSNIDVQLNRRYVLIPNLVEAVKGYMNFEQSVLTKITQLRTQCLQIPSNDISQRAQSENLLSNALSQFWGLVENYPDLKANETVLRLQHDLTDTEDQIQLSRRYYNGTVRNFNSLIQYFPNNLLAKICRFTAQDYFQLENQGQRVAPVVHLDERG